MRTLPLLLALLALPAGCATPEAPAAEAAESAEPAVFDEASDADDDGPMAVADESRDDLLTREVSVEGETEARTYRLADFPDFPVPFSTYVPEDASVQQPGSGDAVAVAWSDAEFMVGVALGATPDEALARLMAEVPEGIESKRVDSDWASGAFSYIVATQGPSYVMTTYVGQHDGTTFVVATTATDEMGDGFAPTADVFFDEWRWADGSAL